METKGFLMDLIVINSLLAKQLLKEIVDCVRSEKDDTLCKSIKE